MGHMRMPAEYRPAFDAGRLLFVSPFVDGPARVTRESAFRRNQVVAALADQALVPYAEPGGQTAVIVEMLHEWGVPVLTA
jgi:predicted Rossmann fold nucleotide-binding protein DprA/Smf involved in DNA uptake